MKTNPETAQCGLEIIAKNILDRRPSSVMRKRVWGRECAKKGTSSFILIQELEEMGEKRIQEYKELLEEHQHILDEVKQLEQELHSNERNG